MIQNKTRNCQIKAGGNSEDTVSFILSINDSCVKYSYDGINNVLV